MKSILLPFLLVVLFTAACAKEKDTQTTISGQVRESGTNKPVANALVKWEWWDIGTVGEERYLIDSMRTNENGEYFLRGNAPDEYLYVHGEALNYYPNDKTSHLMPNVSRGGTQERNISLIPYSWVRLHFINSEGNDAISTNPLPGSTQTFLILTDTLVFAQGYGNQELRFQCFKYKNGSYTSTPTYYISTKGLDTVDFTIHF